MMSVHQVKFGLNILLAQAGLDDALMFGDIRAVVEQQHLVNRYGGKAPVGERFLSIEKEPAELIDQVQRMWKETPGLRNRIVNDTDQVVLVVGRSHKDETLIQKRLDEKVIIAHLGPEWWFEIYKKVEKPNPLAKPVLEEE